MMIKKHLLLWADGRLEERTDPMVGRYLYYPYISKAGDLMQAKFEITMVTDGVNGSGCLVGLHKGTESLYTAQELRTKHEEHRRELLDKILNLIWRDHDD